MKEKTTNPEFCMQNSERKWENESKRLRIIPPFLLKALKIEIFNLPEMDFCVWCEVIFLFFFFIFIANHLNTIMKK